MKVTSVEIKPAFENDGALLAFVGLTLDNELALHDLRLIERRPGRPVLSMPSRKRTERCSRCSEKNVFSARFCVQCGLRLPVRKFDPGIERYIDIAFPISQEFREHMTKEVIEEFLKTIDPNEAQKYKTSWAHLLQSKGG